MINILIHEMKKKIKQEFKKNKTKGKNASYSALMQMIKDENNLTGIWRRRPLPTPQQKKKWNLYQRFFNYLLKCRLERTAKKIKDTYFKQ